MIFKREGAIDTDLIPLSDGDIHIWVPNVFEWHDQENGFYSIDGLELYGDITETEAFELALDTIS